MKIAVLSEISTRDKNPDIISALSGRGHEIINAGMTESSDKPELTYIHTGFIAALLLNLKKVDFVVGGCGTGQGFLISVMQYPGIYCGHILNSLDVWLFTQINGGNCISLALNQGYGWAGEINLNFIFDRLFSVVPGSGYPKHRKQSQKKSRKLLEEISKLTHRTLAEIINDISKNIFNTVFNFPGILELVDINSIEDKKLKDSIMKRLE